MLLIKYVETGIFFVNNLEPLDLNLLEGYLENLGKDILRQMLDLYIQQSVIYLEDIKSALSQCSQQQWQECCHKMKGAAGSVGLVMVHAQLVSIEKSTENSVDKSIKLAELVELNNNAIKALNDWLSN